MEFICVPGESPLVAFWCTAMWPIWLICPVTPTKLFSYGNIFLWHSHCKFSKDTYSCGNHKVCTVWACSSSAYEYFHGMGWPMISCKVAKVVKMTKYHPNSHWDWPKQMIGVIVLIKIWEFTQQITLWIGKPLPKIDKPNQFVIIFFYFLFFILFMLRSENYTAKHILANGKIHYQTYLLSQYILMTQFQYILIIFLGWRFVTQ